FGARDVWFVVGVPIYFYTFLSQKNLGVSDFAFFIVGSFMAIWIIFYGIVQALVPKLKFIRNKTERQLLEAPFGWIIVLSLAPLSLSLLLFLIDQTSVSSLVIMVTGLLVFAVLFAINSSLHSYLILSFTNTERVARDVGFYYMSNALGRLFGTILSGITYQASGLWLCLATSGFMLLISGIGAKKLK
ncbi:MAG: MFS transporter, partial [Paracoccaceae bacterium]